MKISIAHICVRARDLAETEAFYCNALGLTKVFDFIKNGARVGCYLRVTDGSFIEVFEESIEKPGMSPIAHFCLETDDIDAAMQRLSDFGVESTEKKLGCDNTYQIWFKDPNGIDIEFHQYTEKSAQYTGTAVEIDW